MFIFVTSVFYFHVFLDYIPTLQASLPCKPFAQTKLSWRLNPGPSSGVPRRPPWHLCLGTICRSTFFNMAWYLPETNMWCRECLVSPLIHKTQYYILCKTLLHRRKTFALEKSEDSHRQDLTLIFVLHPE